MLYLYTRHHQGIAAMRHTRASQGKPEDNKQDTQRIPRQARAHPEDNTETYQSQPEDTSRIPEPAKAGHETHHSQLKQGMRHTRAHQRTL